MDIELLKRLLRRAPWSARGNLERWRNAGEPATWVAARNGSWNQDDLLRLFGELRRSEFWPLSRKEVISSLEEAKRQWIERREKLSAALRALNGPPSEARVQAIVDIGFVGDVSNLDALAELLQRDDCNVAEAHAIGASMAFLVEWKDKSASHLFVLADDHAVHFRERHSLSLERVLEALEGYLREYSDLMAITSIERLSNAALQAGRGDIARRCSVLAMRARQGRG
jgi:hypothetical protein